jgi:transcription initiation factor TFIIIB Brf1 subunit/transcription initiation factor TFIIB
MFLFGNGTSTNSQRIGMTNICPNCGEEGGYKCVYCKKCGTGLPKKTISMGFNVYRRTHLQSRCESGLEIMTD